MIAIGGTIGTGLFISSGATINAAGPGGALVAYLLSGLMVYFLMTSLGEMATLLPVSGSFSKYASRFVDPAYGFALGWNYWYNSAITVALEIASGAIIMKYWFPTVPSLVWSILFLVVMFLLNYLSVKGYGESEYWFAMIKIKIGRVGGLTEAKKIHDLCELHHIPVWCGGMLEAGIGRAHNIAITTLPNFTLPGDTAASSNYWEKDIIDPEVTVKNGVITVPEHVGIGYEPNRQQIEHYTLYSKVFKF